MYWIAAFAVLVGIWFLARWDLRRWWRSQYPWEHCTEEDFRKHLVRQERKMDIEQIKALSDAELAGCMVAMAEGMVEGMLDEKMTLEEHGAALLMVTIIKEGAERLTKSS